MKKTIIRALSVSAISAASLLAMTGCGVKGATYEKGNPVKVGIICLHDDKSTYDANFINALKEAAKDLGESKMVLTDDCILTGKDENEQCYEAAKDLVKKGCNVVIADSFGHQSYMLKAAQEWPTVQFYHATGTNAKTANLDNYHNAFASIYEGRYLAGYAAGLRLLVDNLSDIYSRTWEGTKVGYVGAFPYAEVKSGYTAWFLGLREVFHDISISQAISGVELPDYADKITMDVKFTNSWYDVNAEASAAEALIKGGATLISQHADSMGAPGVCEEKNIPNVTYNIETGKDCPKTYLAYSRINWAPYYKNIVNSLFEGKALDGEKNHNWTGTLATGSVEYNVNWDNVSKNLSEGMEEVEELLKQVFDLQVKAIKEGKDKVFDTSKFTLTVTDKKNVGAVVDTNKHLTSYKADTDGDFKGDTEVVVAATTTANGYFNESIECSAPYFDLDIDGINLPEANA